MNKTHWKKLYNPNYFGCYCFEDGRDIILTIKNVTQDNVMDEKGRQSECVVIHFVENVKPLICNKTNIKMIEKLYKTPYIEDWGGHKIQLYADRNVRFGKEKVEGVRIRPFIPKSAIPDKTTPTTCEDCTKEITGYGDMSATQVAQRNNAKYGANVCVECASKRKEAGRVADVI